MMKTNVKRIISQLVNKLDIPRSGKSLDEDDSWYPVKMLKYEYQVIRQISTLGLSDNIEGSHHQQESV